MGKKKNKPKAPRRKQMKRRARLESAKGWLPTFTGKDLVRGYSRWFGVDPLCAVRELGMLGVPTDPNVVERLKERVKLKARENAARSSARKRKREQREERSSATFDRLDQDFYHYQIMGYTEGGAAYGITWEEYERMQEPDYYFIAGQWEDGDIFGITWDEYIHATEPYPKERYECADGAITEEERALHLYFGEREEEPV